MAEITTRTLTLKFLGDDGKTKSINLTDYRENLRDEEILTAMNEIVANNVLQRSGINLVSASSAVKTVTTKEEVTF